MSRIYCNLPSFEDVLPLNSNLDDKKDVCKNCIGGFVFPVVKSICVYRSSTFHTGNEHTIFCNNHAHADFHILTHICAYFGVLSNTVDINFVLDIKGALIRNLVIAISVYLSQHKAFTSGLGLDAVSLSWPTVVQLVVSFNSGLQWGISQEYSFFVSSQ